MMGLLDKAKFWKRQEDEGLGDLSDLGDFGLSDKPGAGGSDLGGLGDEFGSSPLGEAGKPGALHDMPGQMEEIHPTAGSKQLSDQLGLRPTQPQQSFPQQQPQQYSAPQQQVQQYPQAQFVPQMQRGQDMSEFAKDIEIIHAKLDAIRSSLDSINQRLATLERIASGDTGRQRYTW